MSHNRLFICYSHADMPFVDRLDADLRQHFPLWRDTVDIPPDIELASDAWFRARQQGAAASSHMAVVMSPDLLEDERAAAEWAWFLAQGRPVYVICYRYSSLPVPLRSHPRLTFEEKRFARPRYPIERLIDLIRSGWDFRPQPAPDDSPPVLPPPSPRLRTLQSHYELATWKASREDFDGALAECEMALQIDPDFLPALLRRAHLNQMLGHPAESLADLDRIITLDPRWLRALWIRASLKETQGDRTGALADFDRLLKLDPAAATALIERAQIKSALRDQAGALADFERAVQLDPTDPWAYFYLAWEKSDQGDDTGALADFDQAIVLDPELGFAYSARSWIRTTRGDFTGALADADLAVALEPDFVSAYNNRAVARAGSGDLAGAEADFTRAIELRPDLASGYYNRSRCRYKLGDLPGTAADIEAVLRLEPENEHREVLVGMLHLIRSNHPSLDTPDTPPSDHPA